MLLPPEKLGSFYLGAEYDLSTATRTETPHIYDARDLVTHAIVVGMTGSGKTGMCVGLLEEAGLDKVPAIIIDPKGDMGNLLLQFPELRPEDFKPWINQGDAERKGQTVDEFAAAAASQWKSGLADWGISGERIQTLQQTVNYTVFTPGSDAGVPINIMGSLAAPDLDWATESEALRERISGTVAALMGLAQIDADPVRSREGVLLASLFEHFWRLGQNLDMKSLILSIQDPPLEQVGVVDVETFYPKKDRFQLAMSFNTVVASPTFQAWLTGEPLDIQNLYFTAEGKPRHSIIYIAHLSDSERMFFVTLLLESIVTWMRRQSGTTSLRALLYFDEIFGYLPPVAQPPSKRPLLTLLKQARAFGLGVVLVTQNPVDLDYKGLSNTGTWVIGKLQAERDKERVLDGLRGAVAESGGGDVDYDAIIGKLGNRVFLMHNVNQKGPVVFTTRWAQSYLRGPLTKVQVRELMKDVKTDVEAGAPVPSEVMPLASGAANAPMPTAAATVSGGDAPAGFLSGPPRLSESVQQVFLPLQISPERAAAQIALETGCEVKRTMLTYEPAALGAASVFFADRKMEIEGSLDQVLLAPFPEGTEAFRWESGEPLGVPLSQVGQMAESFGASDKGPFYAALPESAESASDIKKVQSALGDYLYQKVRLPVKVHEELGIAQKPRESEHDFQVRLGKAANGQRDDEIAKMREIYTKKIDALDEKLAKEEAELARNHAQSQARSGEKWMTWIDTVMKWFVGRRNSSGMSKSMTKYRMAADAEARVKENEIAIEHMNTEKTQLEAELQQRDAEITAKWDAAASEVITQELAPRRTDVNIDTVALAWVPSWVVEYESGGLTRTKTLPAYQPPSAG